MWLFLALLFACTPARADDWAGNVNAFLGGEKLSDSAWWPARKEREAGVELDFGRPGWVVNPVVGLLGGNGNGVIFAPGGPTTINSQTGELDLGVRGVWKPTPLLRPFLGGGLALSRASMEVDTPAGRSTFTDGGAGLWLDAGLYFTLKDAFNVGFDFRVSGANLHLNGQSISTGSGQLGLLLGYHWD